MMFFLIKTSAKNPLGSFWDLQEVALEEVDSSGKYRFPFSRFQSRTREMRKKKPLMWTIAGGHGRFKCCMEHSRLKKWPL